MVQLNLQSVQSTRQIPAPDQRIPLGEVLVKTGVITQAQLDHALRLQSRQNAPLGEILVGEGWASRSEILTALSEQTGCQIADLQNIAPTPELCNLMPSEFWLAQNVLPWTRIGPLLLVATARPDRFSTVSAELKDTGYVIIPVLATQDEIDRAIAGTYSTRLARKAETRVDAAQSCRTWTAPSRALPAAMLLAALGLFALFPLAGMAVVFWASVVSLSLFMALRLTGFLAFVWQKMTREPDEPPAATALRQPCVSILVPLYKEREIADVLIRRLQRLTYPKSLLDVILVLEQEDHVTRQALADVTLPSWIRTIEVPALSGLTTKPRAMNFALDFCRGDILGVWDAEDAPEPDQIERVADHFAQAAPEVVCLQGVLDYYNPRTNWRSRCFTIEYNSWFRVILPGIERMGLVVPLGGTTFFFRRDKLLELGGWDAHNVTEDADLGVRLSRAGYRTEMLGTTTFEEANFRAWPWVKQRSRWLKGFMVTYLVHMRHPLRLLQDLGALRFLGVQAFFLGTVGQFLLAPALWLFWLTTFGFDNPVEQIVPPQTLTVLIGVFVAAEALNWAIGAVAVFAHERRFLLPWIPTMALYYPLGVAAAYKGLWELVFKPFFWDKTQHGQAGEDVSPRAGQHPVSDES